MTISNPCPACAKGMTFTRIPGNKLQETCPEIVGGGFGGGCGYAQIDGVLLVEPSEKAVVSGKVKLETLESMGILRDREHLERLIDRARGRAPAPLPGAPSDPGSAAARADAVMEAAIAAGVAREAAEKAAAVATDAARTAATAATAAAKQAAEDAADAAETAAEVAAAAAKKAAAAADAAEALEVRRAGEAAARKAAAAAAAAKAAAAAARKAAAGGR